MPTCFEIQSSHGQYGVKVAEDALTELLAQGDDQIIIADSCFAPRLRSHRPNAILIAADESAKSLERITDIIIALRDRSVTRQTTLIAIGGGVVQDIAAFVASIYMRGIEWVYVPTTLLSMTDSCIGGKSSINVGKHKNIVGTFHPPSQVIIDPLLADTLSVEQVVAGLCEAAKICFCRGEAAFGEFMALNPVVDADCATVVDVISSSLLAKKWFIEIDEFDQAERLVLNFGHTFGHALETASHFRISHGVAVGLGMLAALRLGERLGRDYGNAPHVERMRHYIEGLLDEVDGLYDILDSVSVDEAMRAFSTDKKHTREAFAVILVDENGAAKRETFTRNARNRQMFADLFESLTCEWRSHVGGRVSQPTARALNRA